jgi:Ca2+-transporting ATPase
MGCSGTGAAIAVAVGTSGTGRSKGVPPVSGQSQLSDAVGQSGLTGVEAARRLVEHGPNTVAQAPRTPAWRRVLSQLRDPLVVVLLVAAALTVVTGDWSDAIIICLVVLVNTTVGVVQEVRADGAIAALSAMTAPTARVVRDGVRVEIASAEVVPGDLVLLGEGDIVPADSRLVDAAALRVDESVLTGEAVAVDKCVGPRDGGIREQSSVMAGTVVVHGRGSGVVTATGKASTMGRIAGLMDVGLALTPLQRRLVGLGRVLAAIAALLCMVVAAIGLLRGQPLELMLVTAVSLVVAAVPESLPAVVTLSLAIGARRMSARHAIVRRLPAIETLGAVTVIATDKTGTLTEGRMVVERLWTPGLEATVTGSGYAPNGAVLTDAGLATGGPRDPLTLLLQAGALCNDASLQPPNEQSTAWAAVGDPTEAALLAAAAKLGVEPKALAVELPRVFELPFDSARRRMTTVHRMPDGAHLVVCKGAPESVLRAPLLMDPEEVVAQAARRAETLAADGYRVLALAQAVRPKPPSGSGDADQVPRDDLDDGLTLLGLIAIADPPRPAAADTIQACLDAGIVPVLITGDHVATALAIARRVGIATSDDAVISGEDLDSDSAPDPTLVRVFARTSPRQKLDIVQAWRDAGHVVAMTGDGVNDGPALRRADIGVAMGRRGTEVARQAADLILADDDLATVVGAVEEGRRVYDNIRRFLLYGLAGGLAEIVVMLVGPGIGLALPLLPAQILWVNLVTHGLPGVALGSEPVEPGSMRRAPRPPAQSVLGDRLWQRIAVLAVVVAATSLGTGVWAHATDRPWQSMLFVALGATQLGIAVGVRARPGTWANPFLLWAVAAAFALQVAALYLPPLPTLLGTTGLSPTDVATVSATSLVGYLAARVDGTRHRTVSRDRRCEATHGGDPPSSTAGDQLTR